MTALLAPAIIAGAAATCTYVFGDAWSQRGRIVAALRGEGA